MRVGNERWNSIWPLIKHTWNTANFRKFWLSLLVSPGSLFIIRLVFILLHHLPPTMSASISFTDFDDAATGIAAIQAELNATRHPVDSPSPLMTAASIASRSGGALRTTCFGIELGGKSNPILNLLLPVLFILGPGGTRSSTNMVAREQRKLKGVARNSWGSCLL